MKVTSERQELKKLSREDLLEKVNDLRKKLFALKLNATTAHIKDYSQFKHLKRSIARTLTYLGQK